MSIDNGMIWKDKQMERSELLKKVAPCGLLCYTCTAAAGGAIKEHSTALLRYLESFDSFAERFSGYEPRLKKYPDFKEVLQLFAEAGCEGCRGGSCMFPVCPCIKEKGIDFCFECDTFPCDIKDFEPGLKAKWLSANERMREIGAEAYFLEAREKSHYL